jgi:uncharacterized Fe-S radical SAM superfamily protein PflX
VRERTLKRVYSNPMEDKNNKYVKIITSLTKINNAMEKEMTQLFHEFAINKDLSKSSKEIRSGQLLQEHEITLKERTEKILLLERKCVQQQVSSHGLCTFLKYNIFLYHVLHVGL